MDNKIMALIGVAILIVGFIIGAVAFPVTNTVEITKEIEVPVEKIVTINSTVEVPVDNGNLEMVLNYLEDIGEIDDTDDFVEEVAFKNAVLEMAIQEIEENGLDEFDDTDFRDDVFDDFKDSEISLRSIYGDMDEVEFADCDVDDEEAEIEVEVKIRGKDSDDKVEANYIFTVEIEDGSAEIIDIDEA